MFHEEEDEGDEGHGAQKNDEVVIANGKVPQSKAPGRKKTRKDLWVASLGVEETEALPDDGAQSDGGHQNHQERSVAKGLDHGLFKKGTQEARKDSCGQDGDHNSCCRRKKLKES
jgi:hypothetical protein